MVAQEQKKVYAYASLGSDIKLTLGPQLYDE